MKKGTRVPFVRVAFPEATVAKLRRLKKEMHVKSYSDVFRKLLDLAKKEAEKQ